MALLLAALVAPVSADDATQALAMANQARLALKLPPLSWDPNLAAFAQYWANIMASNQSPFGHSPVQLRPEQGENIYQHVATQCDPVTDAPLQRASHEWLIEASL